MAETKAKHRYTEEYKRDLVSEVCGLETSKEGLLRQIHRAEIKLKGISTMIKNLQARKDSVQEQIDLIAQQFGQEGADNAELAGQIAKLRKELENIDEKLAISLKMLEEANTTISSAKLRLEELYREQAKVQKRFENDAVNEATQLQKNILSTYNDMVASSVEPLLPTLSDRQKEILTESGFTDLTENASNVINCAMYLALQFIHEATTYAESCGGGGGGNLSGWGRDKDEDDELWWRRCIAQSAAMLRPLSQIKKRKR